jgi:hypothetical protein
VLQHNSGSRASRNLYNEVKRALERITVKEWQYEKEGKVADDEGLVMVDRPDVHDIKEDNRIMCEERLEYPSTA